MANDDTEDMTDKAPENETEEEVEERFANQTKRRFQKAREAFSRGEVRGDPYWYEGKKYDKD